MSLEIASKVCYHSFLGVCVITDIKAIQVQTQAASICISCLTKQSGCAWCSLLGSNTWPSLQTILCNGQSTFWQAGEYPWHLNVRPFVAKMLLQAGLSHPGGHCWAIALNILASSLKHVHGARLKQNKNRLWAPPELLQSRRICLSVFRPFHTQLKLLSWQYEEAVALMTSSRSAASVSGAPMAHLQTSFSFWYGSSPSGSCVLQPWSQVAESSLEVVSRNCEQKGPVSAAERVISGK